MRFSELAGSNNYRMFRRINHIFLESPNIPDIRFLNIITSLDINNWIFFGISFGWRSRGSNYSLCLYISQGSSNYENEEWVDGISSSNFNLDPTNTFFYTFGPGLDGYLKEVYTTAHLDTPFSFKMFNNSINQKKYNCFSNDFYQDVYTVDTGWGNGYMLPSETNEEWDDLNIVDGDGWDSNWEVEPLFKWTSTGEGGTSQWENTWLNGIYEPEYEELCDDGDSDDTNAWSNTWTVGDGWDWSSQVVHQVSVCDGVWGDSMKVSAEAWDDGDNTDNIGCLNDWSGAIDGYHCSGGDRNKNDIWEESWGDGHITSSETWEDGGTSNGDGCSHLCQQENGWTWESNNDMTYSQWNPKWGDGIKIGPETCDDGNKYDNEGCNEHWNGTIRGWHWVDDTFPASVWHTDPTDGIRVIDKEECDDGNNEDGDGWTILGTIEDKWTWTEDASDKSICTRLWGNGELDAPDEKWDDGNKEIDDGCDSSCQVESGWEWFNKVSSSLSKCNEKSKDEIK